MIRVLLFGCVAILSLGCGRVAYQARHDAGADTSVDAGPLAIPPVGLYTVNVDGTGLSLLVDTGSRQLTFAERLRGTEWIAATRFNVDFDGNGLALLLEDNVDITGTDVVLFRESDPTTVSVVAGGNPTLLEGFQTWTDDGRLIFTGQEVINETVVRRATFSTMPSVAAMEIVQIPPELTVPFMPHQRGPSDATGRIFLSATRETLGAVWSEIWGLPAAGTSSMTGVTAYGCPGCGGGVCCTTSTRRDMFETLFPRISHAGDSLLWIEEHPSVSFGSPIEYPTRPRARGLSSGDPLVDLTPAGTIPTTWFGEMRWRSDDREVLSWYLTLVGAQLRSFLFRMQPDGSGRQIIPLPDPLCPMTASYLTDTRVLFSAYRCGGAPCSCEVTTL